MQEKDLQKIFSYQDDAINNLVRLDNTVTKNEKGKSFYSTLVVVPTGGGKTRIATRYLYEKVFTNSANKALWLGERLSLLKQTENSFREWDNNQNKEQDKKRIEIQHFSSEESDYREKIQTSTRLAIFTQQTLSKAIDEENIESILKEWLKDTDTLTVIIDEAHHATTRAYQNILYTLDVLFESDIFKSYHVIGLTATPKKVNQEDTEELGDVFFHGIDNNTMRCSTKTNYAYEISIQDLIAKGVLAKPYLVDIKDDEDCSMLDKIVDVYSGGLKGLKLWDVQEQEEVHMPVEFGKTIIFVDSRKEALELVDKFEKKDIRCGLGISIDKQLFISKDDSEDEEKSKQAELLFKQKYEQAEKDFIAFKEQDLDLIVSVDKLREGIDVPMTQTVFIAHNLKNEFGSTSPLNPAWAVDPEVRYTQMIGRALRGKYLGGTDVAFIVSFGDDSIFNNILWSVPEAQGDFSTKFTKPKEKKISQEDITLNAEEEVASTDTINSLVNDILKDFEKSKVTSTVSKKEKNIAIMKGIIKAYGCEKYLPVGFYHFANRHFIIWDVMLNIVTEINNDISGLSSRNEIVKIKRRSNVEWRKAVLLKSGGILRDWAREKDINLECIEKTMFIKLVSEYLTYALFYYRRVCRDNKVAFDKGTRLTKFPCLEDYKIHDILWGYEDLINKGTISGTEEEIKEYLNEKWSEVDKKIWTSREYFEAYFTTRIKRLSGLRITPEVKDKYVRLRLYREGKKRENLCNMLKQIIKTSGLWHKRMEFVDVFGGIGTVTAQMETLFGNRRVYNEYDVVVANFLYWVCNERDFSEKCIKYFEEWDKGKRDVIKSEDIDARKEIEKIEETGTSSDFLDEDTDEIESKIYSLNASVEKKVDAFYFLKEKYANKYTRTTINAMRALKSRYEYLVKLRETLKNDKIAEYVRSYIAYYHHCKENLDINSKPQEEGREKIQEWREDINTGGRIIYDDKKRYNAYEFIFSRSFPSLRASGEHSTGIDPVGIKKFRESLLEENNWLSEFCSKMYGITVISKDFMEILPETDKKKSKKAKGKEAIYYLDPPYFLTKQYAEGFPDKFHLKMLKWFRETDCNWILSCKSCPTNKLTWLKKRKGDYNVLIEYKDGAKGNYGKNREWLNHDKDDISLREYFRLFLYEEVEDRTKNKITFYRADIEKGKRNTRELFVYHGKNAAEEHFEIMISNIKVPDEHQYILENSGIIMEPFEEFFRPLLEN